MQYGIHLQKNFTVVVFQMMAVQTKFVKLLFVHVFPIPYQPPPFFQKKKRSQRTISHFFSSLSPHGPPVPICHSPSSFEFPFPPALTNSNKRIDRSGIERRKDTQKKKNKTTRKSKVVVLLEGCVPLYTLQTLIYRKNTNVSTKMLFMPPLNLREKVRGITHVCAKAEGGKGKGK